jgi:hypothetical protein
VQRREILTGLLGIGSSVLIKPTPSAAASPLKVGVVGGGIVGASIAWWSPPEWLHRMCLQWPVAN